MFLPAALVLLTIAQPPAAKPFELKDGDRIVWIGNTLVEREQRYGYWETALLAANPDKKITVRNLGWSGDTVFGDARAGFDNAAKGFERLVSLTLELKPTVIFVSYGTNESFEGKEGLPKFEKGLEKLLDALKPANARIVLFTPTPYEVRDNLPDASGRNKQLASYADVVKRVASRRTCAVADLYGGLTARFEAGRTPAAGIGSPPHPSLTENGIHLSGRGYLLTTGPFLKELGIQPRTEKGVWSIRETVFVPVEQDPEIVKLDPLRQAIVAKNELFFYRWRPQNETYLFGFRKHEQGKNAKEVAEFDPLVSKAEEEIDKILKTLK